MSKQPPPGDEKVSIEGGDEREDYESKIRELDEVIENLIGHPDLNGTQEKRNEMLKKRNAFYAQRKYYRKKIQIRELEKQRDNFVEKNSIVRAENKMLEEMLELARQQVRARKVLEVRNTDGGISELMARISRAVPDTAAVPARSSYPDELPFLGLPSLAASRFGLASSASADGALGHSRRLVDSQSTRDELLARLWAERGLPDRVASHQPTASLPASSNFSSSSPIPITSGLLQRNFVQEQDHPDLQLLLNSLQRRSVLDNPGGNSLWQPATHASLLGKGFSPPRQPFHPYGLPGGSILTGSFQEQLFNSDVSRQALHAALLASQSDRGLAQNPPPVTESLRLLSAEELDGKLRVLPSFPTSNVLSAAPGPMMSQPFHSGQIHQEDHHDLQQRLEDLQRRIALGNLPLSSPDQSSLLASALDTRHWQPRELHGSLTAAGTTVATASLNLTAGLQQQEQQQQHPNTTPSTQELLFHLPRKQSGNGGSALDDHQRRAVLENLELSSMQRVATQTSGIAPATTSAGSSVLARLQREQLLRAERYGQATHATMSEHGMENEQDRKLPASSPSARLQPGNKGCP